MVRLKGGDPLLVQAGVAKESAAFRYSVVQSIAASNLLCLFGYSARAAVHTRQCAIPPDAKNAGGKLDKQKKLVFIYGVGSGHDLSKS